MGFNHDTPAAMGNWPKNDREWARTDVGEPQFVASPSVAYQYPHDDAPHSVPANQKGNGCTDCVGECAYRKGGYCAGPLAPRSYPHDDAPRTIIAFTGLAGAGKSTAAKYLTDHRGFRRIRFAGPLKAMMAALGCSQEQIDGSEKEMPCELLGGKTPRHAMQTLGTEWGRDLIASDLWIRAWQHALANVPPSVSVVVDDCRFPNEADAVIAAGGIVVRVERPGAGTASVHSSEAHALPHVRTIHNVLSEKNLCEQVDVLVRDLSWADTARI